MKKRDSFLFLFEMIMAMLIFFIAASICVSVFAQAHRMNRESRELNAATSAEKNIAELLSAADGMNSAQTLIREMYPQAVITATDPAGEKSADGGSASAGGKNVSDKDLKNGFTVYIGFDSDFQAASCDKAGYLLTADVTADDHLMSAGIHFYPVTENTADSGSGTDEAYAVSGAEQRTDPAGDSGEDGTADTDENSMGLVTGESVYDLHVENAVSGTEDTESISSESTGTAESTASDDTAGANSGTSGKGAAS